MYNDLNEHKRSDNIKWICTLIAFILLFSCVVALIVPVYINIGKDNKSTDVEKTVASEAEEQTQPAAFVMTPQQEHGIRLMSLSGTPEALATDDAYTQTIQATVLPEDAPDKDVVWTLKWADSAPMKGNDISQYLTVTPKAGNSTIATVVCLKPFLGSEAVLTATTKIGEHTATCAVRYLGIPTSLTIDTSKATIKQDTNFNASVVEVRKGESVTLPFVMDNEMHSVGTTFGNYDVKIEVIGTLLCTKTIYNAAGEVTNTLTETVNMTLGNFWESEGYVYASAYAGGYSNSFIKISKVTGGFKVDAEGFFSDYEGMSASPSGRAEMTFGGYGDGKMPYFKVTFTEKDTGLTTSVNVRPIQTVNSVSVDQSVIEY